MLRSGTGYWRRSSHARGDRPLDFPRQQPQASRQRATSCTHRWRGASSWPPPSHPAPVPAAGQLALLGPDAPAVPRLPGLLQPPLAFPSLAGPLPGRPRQQRGSSQWGQAGSGRRSGGGGGGAGLCAGWQVTTAGEQSGVRAGVGSLFSGPCSPLLTICLNLTCH